MQAETGAAFGRPWQGMCPGVSRSEGDRSADSHHRESAILWITRQIVKWFKVLHKDTYQHGKDMGIVRSLFPDQVASGMKKLTIIALAGALLAGHAAAAQFYKWTDENGVTHYSEAPPPETVKNSTEVKVPSRQPSGTEAAAQNLQKQREAALKALDEAGKKKPQPTPTAAAKGDKEKNAERCKQLQANLAVMENSGRVSEKDEKGEKRYLTEEEKAKRLDDTRRQIKAYCE